MSWLPEAQPAQLAGSPGTAGLLLTPCPLFSFATRAALGSRVEGFGGLLFCFVFFSLSSPLGSVFGEKYLQNSLSEGLSSKTLAGWVCWFHSVFVCPAAQEEIVTSV